MESKVRRFIRVLCLPVFALSFRSSGSQGVNPRYLVTPLLTVVHVFVGLLVIIGILAANQDRNESSNITNWCVIMTCVFAGLVSSVVLLVFGYQQINVWNELEEPSLNLRLGFLWIFGIAYLLHFCLNLLDIIDCIGTMLHTTHATVSIITNIISIMFILLQLVLISYYRKATFKCRTFVNISVMCILLANFSTWYNTFINMTTWDHKSQYRNISCFYNSYFHTNISRKIAPFLQPERVEFSILASFFLISIWCKSSQMTTCPEMLRHNSQYEALDADEPQCQQNATCQHDQSCQCNLQRQHDPQRRHGLTCEKNAPCQDTQECQYDPQHQQDITCQHDLNVYRGDGDHTLLTKSLAPVLGILINLPICLSMMLLAVIYEWRDVTVIIILDYAQAFSAICTCIMVIVCIHILKKNYKYSQKSLTASESTLILSSTGIIAFCTIGLTAGLSGQTLTTSIVTSRLFGMLEAYLQTYFFITSSRFERQGSPSRFVSSCGVILVITNLMYWALNSYNRGMFSETRFGLFSSLGLIKSTLVPLLTFYRFYSGMHAYSLYYRNKQ